MRARVLAEEHLCRWCGQPVDKTLPGSHPMGPVADHLIERVAGGDPLDRANLGLMHRTCNQAKENERRRRIGPSMRVSRSW